LSLAIPSPQNLSIFFVNLLVIPVIASSGAGKVEHFSEVFEKTGAEAALAAGIFHREEVPISAVKEHLRERGIETR